MIPSDKHTLPEKTAQRYVFFASELLQHRRPASRGSVANYRKQESLDSQVIDFPIHDFRILPRKGNFATEPEVELEVPC